jgi:hypothetical protein
MRSNRYFGGPALDSTRAPAPAIALWIRERGAAYSGEILDAFGISQATLRRRRAELRWLGIEFVQNGRGSLYVTSELARQLPRTSQAQRLFRAGAAAV